MTQCELTETCVFFNDQMASMPSTAAVYKKIFCGGEFDTCGRYLIFKALGREDVPKDLFPNQSERAKTIISAHGK